MNPYGYVANPLKWIDPLGLCKTEPKTGADVTEDMIKKALEGDTMQTVQADVSLPAIQRYVDRLLKGDVAPPIKVENNIIVDGNHRYIAGKILGKTPETTPGTLPLSKASDAKPISDIGVSDIDWGNR